MKVLTVLGARPQFIKAAVVSRAFARFPKISECMVHTGQHFDKNMSEIFFKELSIPEPKYNLGIHEESQLAMLSGMLSGLEKVIKKEQPDLVLVYGDTNSTLAGAIAAKSAGVQLAHVEAGMRSYRLQMKEEMNRVLTDRISDFLFCATPSASQNLVKEGYDRLPVRMVVTGDVMYDAFLFYDSKVKERKTKFPELANKQYVLCTLHRAENVDRPDSLEGIVEAINELAKEYTIVLPLHPRTRNALKSAGFKINALIVEPQGYLDMQFLVQSSFAVITDSGGLQKEACFAGKPCVVVRDETEWTDLLDAGCLVLGGTFKTKIVEAFKQISSQRNLFNPSFFGDGKAGEKIAGFIDAQFQK